MSLLFSCQIVSNSLWPHGLQHTRLPCPSLSPYNKLLDFMCEIISENPPFPGWVLMKQQWERKDFILGEKARVGCFKRTASKHEYYLGWNRSPAQVGCMRQALGPGALGKPRGSGWRGRWEGGFGWGTRVNPWLFHFNVWQNPPQIKIK